MPAFASLLRCCCRTPLGNPIRASITTSHASVRGSSLSSPPPERLLRFYPGINPFLRMEVLRSLFNRLHRCFWTSGSTDKNEATVEQSTNKNKAMVDSSTNKSKAMVEQLQHRGTMKSKKVAEVMETIDRGLFVPDSTSAYVDSPMPIGYNATISAPHMHATCLELLEEHLQPGMRALDVGSGTGYLTACFAMMVGPQGRVVGVEHIPELVASSIKNINRSAASSLLKEGSLSVHVADGRLGWPELAPFDAIHVGAAAPEIPQPLIEQLKPGGRLVIPVGTSLQDLKVVNKKPGGSVTVRSETSVRYIPLTSREAQLRSY